MQYVKHIFIIQVSTTPKLNINTLEVYRCGVFICASLVVCTIAVTSSGCLDGSWSKRVPVKTCIDQNVYGSVKTCTGPSQNVYNKFKQYHYNLPLSKQETFFFLTIFIEKAHIKTVKKTVIA